MTSGLLIALLGGKTLADQSTPQAALSILKRTTVHMDSVKRSHEERYNNAAELLLGLRVDQERPKGDCLQEFSRPRKIKESACFSSGYNDALGHSSFDHGLSW